MATPAALSANTDPSPASERETLGAWQRFSFSLIHKIVAAQLWVLGLSGLYVFACWFGTVEWLVNYRRRRRFAATLQHVLGRTPTAREKRRIGREFFLQSRCDKVLYLIFDCLSPEQATALFEIVNRQVLDDAASQGRGVCVATSHLGSQHLGGMFMSVAGYKVAGVRAPGESGLRRWVQERWDRMRAETDRAQVIFNDNFPREIYRWFERGYLIGSSMDVARVHHPNLRTEEVTFFGEKRPFLSGPIRIAIRCRAPVLQCFLIPTSGFRYRLEILGPLVDTDRVTNEALATAEAMQAYAANVERYTRTYPQLITRL